MRVVKRAALLFNSFALMLQNKLLVYVARFTETLKNKTQGT